MQTADKAIPSLPSRSILATVAFYRSLGFDGDSHAFDANYAVLTRGAIELHFFAHPQLDPATSWAGCYLRVVDVEEIYQAFARCKLALSGIPRMDSFEKKPWGLREFAIVDLDGNLLRIGQLLTS
jgi:catechol 2,3-dioxygenase-like lactoylglutathione lyase family enzyme